MSIFSEIGKHFPDKMLGRIKGELRSANIDNSPQEWIGKNLVAALIISLLVSVVVNSFWRNPAYTVLAFSLSVFIYYFAMSSIVGLLIDQRVKSVESVLPDVLLLIASNLKSGVSPDEAISLSARPEFGFISEHIRMVGKKISTGVPLQDAVLELSKGIDSPALNKTVNLIIEGMESGGELSTILEETANDIRDTEILQKEIRSIISVYAIFIFIAAIIVAPVLYAVSTHLSQTLTKLSSEASVAFLTKGSAMPAIIPGKVTPEFLLTFSYVNLIITSVFGALMIALINRGNERYGLKYIPIFIAITLVLFLIARFFIGSFFQTIRI